MGKLSTKLLSNQWVKKITNKIRKYFEANKNEDRHTKTYWMQLNSAQREMCNYKYLYYKKKNDQINDLTCQLKEKNTFKKEQAKPLKAEESK